MNGTIMPNKKTTLMTSISNQLHVFNILSWKIKMFEMHPLCSNETTSHFAITFITSSITYSQNINKEKQWFLRLQQSEKLAICCVSVEDDPGSKMAYLGSESIKMMDHQKMLIYISLNFLNATLTCNFLQMIAREFNNYACSVKKWN